MKYSKMAWILMGLLVMVFPLLAQAECPAIVEEALNAVGDNCADLERNAACYGYDRVDSTFTAPQPPDFFSQPADRSGLLELETIQTAALNTATGDFGVAVMNVQANVPESLPGQGVIFLLLGDTSLTNMVAAEDTAQPIEAVTITTAEEITLFSLPSTNASARATVPAGTELQTDGTDAAGDWLRIVTDNGIAWAERSRIVPDAVLDRLPVLDTAHKTPMQAFYFTTGIGQPECNEAEATIAVQSPENITVELTVNGLEIQVGSLVTFTNNTLTVHRGGVTTSDEQIVHANETLELERDEDGNFIGQGSLRPINEAEFRRGERVQQGINNVAAANGWELRQITQRIDLPPGSQVLPDGTVLHIVQRGDTLYRIALLYKASAPDIAEANDLTSPFILSIGQRLRIPNPGSGFKPLPPHPGGKPVITLTPTETGVTGPVIDCSTFRIISGGETFISTFRWTPLPGADQYKINFYGSEGRYVTSLLYPASVTAVDINMGDIGTGYYFQWHVEALLNGQTLCATLLSALMQKPLDPNPPLPPPAAPPPFVASRTCQTPQVATVTWANVKPNDAVNVFGKDVSVGPDYNQTFFATSGTVTISVPVQLSFITVSTTSGDVVSLPGC